MYTKIFRASVKVPQCYSFLLVDAMVSKPHPQAILWFLQDKGFLSLFVTAQSPSYTLEVRAGSCPGTAVQVRLQIPAGLPGWHGWAHILPWSAGGQHRDTSSHTGLLPAPVGSLDHCHLQHVLENLKWLWNCPQVQSLWDGDQEAPSLCQALGPSAWPWQSRVPSPRVGRMDNCSTFLNSVRE